MPGNLDLLFLNGKSPRQVTRTNFVKFATLLLLQNSMLTNTIWDSTMHAHQESANLMLSQVSWLLNNSRRRLVIFAMSRLVI